MKQFADERHSEELLSESDGLDRLKKDDEFFVAFKERFCFFNSAPYLEESDRTLFAIDFKADSLSLELDEVFSNLRGIICDIEYEHPLQSLNLWLDLMMAVDQFAPGAHHDELLYNCATHAFILFESDVGHSRNRVFYFNKLLGCLGTLRNASEATLETLFGQLKASASLLLRREDQARAVMKVSKLYLRLSDHGSRVTECIHRCLSG